MESAQGPVQVAYPEGWTYAYNPIRLIDPEGKVRARVGDVVAVNGDFLDEEVSFCRGPAFVDGPAFVATEVVHIDASSSPLPSP